MIGLLRENLARHHTTGPDALPLTPHKLHRLLPNFSPSAMDSTLENGCGLGVGEAIDPRGRRGEREARGSPCPAYLRHRGGIAWAV